VLSFAHWFVVCLMLVLACSPSPSPNAARLQAVEASATLGPGDVFEMQIVGEQGLPDEYQVATDGTVDLPYLHSMKVSGLEPHELARLVRERLMTEKFLTDPSVVIRVKEYRSKQITILGQVRSPGNYPYQPGMTLIQAISVAGGVNSIAVRDAIRVTRRRKEGGTMTVVIDLDAIIAGSAEDVPMHPGDRIYVSERVF
jgi:polysaccharide export outer membrane protein